MALPDRNWATHIHAHTHTHTYSFTVLFWGEQLQADAPAQPSTRYRVKTHTFAVILIWINCALSLKNNPPLSNLSPYVFLPLTVALLLLYSMSRLQSSFVYIGTETVNRSAPLEKYPTFMPGKTKECRERCDEPSLLLSIYSSNVVCFSEHYQQLFLLQISWLYTIFQLTDQRSYEIWPHLKIH